MPQSASKRHKLKKTRKRIVYPKSHKRTKDFGLIQ